MFFNENAVDVYANMTELYALLDEVATLDAHIAITPGPYAYLAPPFIATATQILETCLVEEGQTPPPLHELGLLRKIAETTEPIELAAAAERHGDDVALVELFIADARAKATPIGDVNDAFDRACANGNSRIAALLLGHGVENALTKAISVGCTEIVRQLLGKVVDYNAVLTACRKGFTDIVDMVLGRGLIARYEVFVPQGYYGAGGLIGYDDDYDETLCWYRKFVNGACENSHLGVLRLFFKHFAITNYWPNADVLFAACRVGNIDIVRLVLELTPPGCKMFEKFDSARALACDKGFVEIFRLLLQLPDECFNTFHTETPRLPLDVAIRRGHTEIVRMILKMPPERRTNAYEGDVLCIANPEIVRMVIDSITTPFERSRVCRTAGKDGRTDIIRMLIANARKHGDLKMDDGGALERAAAAGHVEIIRLFLGQRIRYTVIEAASKYGHVEIVRLLIDNQLQKFGESNIGESLVIACHAEQVKVVRLLLSYPRYRCVNREAIEVATSLAANENDRSTDILRMLLDAVPAELRTELGSSLDGALKQAVNNNAVFRLLLKHCDPKSVVPLRVASEYRNVDMVRFLLECGGGDDVVALRLAQKHRHTEIVNLLSKKQKDTKKPQSKHKR